MTIARLCKIGPFILAVGCLAGGASLARAQFGTVLAGTGPVNFSMAGASTAAPLSADGALYWNPATLSGLDRSELDAGADLIWPHTELDSHAAAGAFGPGFPPIGLSGSTKGTEGVMPTPSIGLAYRPENSDVSFGLGIYAVAGFGVDYPGSTSNFPLTAPPPVGLGFGPLFSQFEVLQITPAIAYRLTDRLSIGAGPSLDIAELEVTPGIFAPPDNASGNGFATYPDATRTETTWGGGFEAGVYYKGDSWGLGASYKSPQWLDTFRFNSTDQLGNPRELSLDLSLPQIISTGIAYTGLERWVFALDGRWLDYRDAKFFGDSGFTATGALRGLDWRSIFAIAAGVQYQWTDAITLRGGYSWNQNPIRDPDSFINSASPLVLENSIYAGASWHVTEDFSVSMGYAHAFENSVTGPLVTPAGAVPGTSIKNSTSADLLMLGATIRFGCADRGPAPVAAGEPDLASN